MKKFENPFLEVVRFGGKDIVRTSNGCCDVGGIVFDEDDDVCGSRDGECTTNCA